ncbi:MAG: hypothetical protein ABI680_07080 [Chthoniobacteraceae bacterium]
MSFTIGMRFADTNVLLYSVGTVASEEGKARKAQALLANRDIALSVRVSVPVPTFVNAAILAALAGLSTIVPLKMEWVFLPPIS